MDVFAAFRALPSATAEDNYPALLLPGRSLDFLAKTVDGSPVFLLRDRGSSTTYVLPIELRHVSVRFQNECRVATASGPVEDTFAVVACDGTVPELHELFVRCLNSAVAQLPAEATTSEIQESMQGLLNLFRTLARPSSQEITGLWAELFVIAQCHDISRALTCWHANHFERYDFSWPGGCLEVKSSIGEARVHDFAFEQLQAPAGYVASVLLQPLSGGVGVLELANLIESAVSSQADLRQKLWENVGATLGSDFVEKLDRRFDMSYAARKLALYRMLDVPQPEDPRDARITAMRFRSDLSTVTSSCLGDAKAELRALF